jgi:polyisoprenyl-phosphate glycosyltransferase
MNNLLLSFIIPVYQGERTIEPLFDEIVSACNEYGYQFEVVFIWDCGPDLSWGKILSLKSKYPEKIIGIRLTRNFGQHNAIICGFSKANGDFMLTMDEDLQHNPKDVKLLVQKQQEANYDVVYGSYTNSQHNSFRNITSRILKSLLEIGISELNRDYSPFRMIKRDIALATVDMQNSYTFLDGYISWVTSNVASIEVSHNIRKAGVSSYTLRKLIRHSINIFITFSTLPIRVVTYLSLLFFVFTFAYAFYILMQKLIFNNLIPGFASIIVILGFGIGSILLSISVLGEYIHRINLKTTRRPNFRISEIL